MLLLGVTLFSDFLYLDFLFNLLVIGYLPLKDSHFLLFVLFLVPLDRILLHLLDLLLDLLRLFGLSDGCVCYWDDPQFLSD